MFKSYVLKLFWADPDPEEMEEIGECLTSAAVHPASRYEVDVDCLSLFYEETQKHVIENVAVDYMDLENEHPATSHQIEEVQHD